MGLVYALITFLLSVSKLFFDKKERRVYGPGACPPPQQGWLGFRSRRQADNIASAVRKQRLNSRPGCKTSPHPVMVLASSSKVPSPKGSTTFQNSIITSTWRAFHIQPISVHVRLFSCLYIDSSAIGYTVEYATC